MTRRSRKMLVQFVILAIAVLDAVILWTALIAKVT